MRNHVIKALVGAVVVNVLLLVNLAEVSATRLSTTLKPPVVQADAPVYPVVALTQNASGALIVEAQIDANGLVESVRTIDGSKLLSMAAENSARRWVFAPTDDKVGLRVVRLTFVFKIMPKDTPFEDLLPIFMPPYRVEVKGTKPNLIHRVDSDPPMTKRPAGSRKKKP